MKKGSIVNKQTLEEISKKAEYNRRRANETYWLRYVDFPRSEIGRRLYPKVQIPFGQQVQIAQKIA